MRNMPVTLQLVPSVLGVVPVLITCSECAMNGAYCDSYSISLSQMRRTNGA